jgi:hypothetical protein
MDRIRQSNARASEIYDALESNLISSQLGDLPASDTPDGRRTWLMLGLMNAMDDLRVAMEHIKSIPDGEVPPLSEEVKSMISQRNCRPLQIVGVSTVSEALRLAYEEPANKLQT